MQEKNAQSMQTTIDVHVYYKLCLFTLELIKVNKVNTCFFACFVNYFIIDHLKAVRF